MSEKRRDNKNRILQTGESQRKDGRYVYKYNDNLGQVKFVYAWRLVPTDKTPSGKREDLSLREKEKEITSVLQSAPKSDIILAQLKNVGLDLDAFVKQYSKEKILNAVWYAKDLKDRYSVLWLFGAVSPAAPYSQPQ